MRIFDGKTYRDMTPEEIAKMQEAQARFEAAEKRRPRTMEEGTAELLRTVLSDKLTGTDDKTLAIACMAFFAPWTRGAYAVGDIRTDPDTGYPRECMIAHDSRVNTDWTIKTASIWKPFHSRKREYALPWEQPTGAHDMYKTGEYMIWEDDKTYLCKRDTNFSPADDRDAWEVT